jgi:hypothetical protein
MPSRDMNVAFLTSEAEASPRVVKPARRQCKHSDQAPTALSSSFFDIFERPLTPLRFASA